MWNGNEDKEGLKEGFEKGEVIESIRVNGCQFVGIQITGKQGSLFEHGELLHVWERSGQRQNEGC